MVNHCCDQNYINSIFHFLATEFWFNVFSFDLSKWVCGVGCGLTMAGTPETSIENHGLLLSWLWEEVNSLTDV